MNLNELAIEARPRSAWQALDLGIMMTRHWYKDVCLIWMLPSLCLFTALCLAFPGKPWIALLCCWWLKPLWDRGVIKIASQRLFGTPLSYRDVLKSLWSLYRRDIFLALTLHRFSPSRSYDIPVNMLEGLKGKARSQRLAILHKKYGHAATWLIITAVHIELFFGAAVLVLLEMLIPPESRMSVFADFFEFSPMLNWLSVISSYLAMLAVGPFYACSGFALYISRRIDLEAWDIEIRFRHIAQNRAQRSNISAKSSLLPAVFIVTAFLSSSLALPPRAYATEHLSVNERVYQQELSELSNAKQRAIAIKQGEHFKRLKTTKAWRLRGTESEEPEAHPDWLIDILKFIEKNFGFFRSLSKIISTPGAWIEPLLWLLFVFTLSYLLYRSWLHLKQFTGNSRRKNTVEQNRPAQLFGLDIRAESLPRDITATVMQLWEQQQARAAIALLYRATLSRLVSQHKLHFRGSDTEGECLRRVQAGCEPKIASLSAAITGIWQNIAYGHVVPPQHQVEQLCVRWQDAFGDE